MKIHASVGNAPSAVSLRDEVYSLRLVADTKGEKQRLAGMLKAIANMDPAVLRKKPPKVRIIETKAR